jgi:KamA family protein
MKIAPSHWQAILQTNVTCPNELCGILQLPTSIVSTKAMAIQSLNVTRDYLSRVEIGNPNDPLLLQILPTHKELDETPGFSCDPLEEMGGLGRASCKNKIFNNHADIVSEQNILRELPVLQKYPGRALVLATDSCASNCRFCFRRHFFKKTVDLEAPEGTQKQLPNLISFFEQKSDEISSIREIILSGGDPLMLGDVILEGVLNYIKDLQPGNRVRLHTRLPVMLPERVTPQLIDLLKNFRSRPNDGPVYLVLHVNHHNELSEKVLAAIANFVDAGIPVLSQTVLLRQINDDFETLFDLFEKLTQNRVIPYYLHQLDRVQGAAHFEVPMAKGAELVTKLRATLPGYAVPRYIREISGLSQKTLI